MFNKLFTNQKKMLSKILLIAALIITFTPFSIILQTQHSYTNVHQVYSNLISPNIAVATESPNLLKDPVGYLWGKVTGGISGGFGALIGFIGGLLNSVFGQVMIWAGWGFDTAIEWTITDYSTYFGPTTAIQGSIDSAWVTFRDLANIALIGVFVFIAFNVMLNVTSFSASKFAVRVLVIAVLINFSLFFTKVVIDISNVTAIQFYKQLNTEHSIATQILAKTGMLSLSKSDGILEKISTTASGASLGWKNGAGATFAYVISSSLLIAGMTSILLYAIILLFSRALMFVFLMITSPLAFAAYMIPQMEGHWKKWWGLLLRNAFFAPLFMLLLSITLKIMNGLPGSGASLEKLILGQKDGVSGIFNIIIILGLLFGSIKISSQLSLIGTDIAEKISKKSFGFMAKWGGAGLVVQGAAGLYNLGNKGARYVNRSVPGWHNTQWAQRLDARLGKMRSNEFSKTDFGKKFEKETGLASTQPVGDYAMNKFKAKADKEAKERAAAADRIALVALKKQQNRQANKEKDGVEDKEIVKETQEESKIKLDNIQQDLKDQLKDSEDVVRGHETNLTIVKTAEARTADVGAKEELKKEISEREAELSKEGVKIEKVKEALDKLKNSDGTTQNLAEEELQKVSNLVQVMREGNLQNKKYQRTTLKRERNRKDLDSRSVGSPTEISKRVQATQEEFKEFKSRPWDNKSTKEAKAKAADIYSRKQKSSGNSSGSSSDDAKEELINKLSALGIDKDDAAKAIN